jgi:hypothetical protein
MSPSRFGRVSDTLAYRTRDQHRSARLASGDHDDKLTDLDHRPSAAHPDISPVNFESRQLLLGAAIGCSRGVFKQANPIHLDEIGCPPPRRDGTTLNCRFPRRIAELGGVCSKLNDINEPHFKTKQNKDESPRLDRSAPLSRPGQAFRRRGGLHAARTSLCRKYWG